MLLTGTYERSIDEKLRIAIPKRLRDLLEPHAHEALFIAPGTDISLCVYTESALASLAERLANTSPVQNEVRAFSRLFYAQAERVELDSQGRFRIPPHLARMAELSRDAVLLGVRDHLEIWDKARWESYLAERASRYDELAERAFRPAGSNHPT